MALLTYLSSAAYAITLAGLASSPTLLAGRESGNVSNLVDLARDRQIGGQITVAAAGLSAGSIQVWAYTALDDTPTWPGPFTGLDADLTLTDDAEKFSILYRIVTIETDTTPSRVYSFGQASLRGAPFAGTGAPLVTVPKFHGVFVTHTTGAALAAGTIWHTGSH